MQKPPASEGSAKSDAAMKMYEMGEENERKPFLDKLFNYMDEKGSPITSMPMISKNPIDLFKLYNLVKEKGGLLEVCQNDIVLTNGHFCNFLHFSSNRLHIQMIHVLPVPNAIPDLTRIQTMGDWMHTPILI